MVGAGAALFILAHAKKEKRVVFWKGILACRTSPWDVLHYFRRQTAERKYWPLACICVNTHGERRRNRCRATAKRPFSHLWRFLIPAAQKVSFQLPIVSANKPVCRRPHKAKHTPVSQNTKPRWNFSPDFRDNIFPRAGESSGEQKDARSRFPAPTV